MTKNEPLSPQTRGDVLASPTGLVGVPADILVRIRNYFNMAAFCGDRDAIDIAHELDDNVEVWVTKFKVVGHGRIVFDLDFASELRGLIDKIGVRSIGDGDFVTAEMCVKLSNEISRRIELDEVVK